VGGAFAVLGAMSWLRGHVVPPRVFLVVAMALALPALIAPAALGPVQRAWMRGAAVLGRVNARIMLTVVFFVVLVPIGLVLRCFRDPLDRSLEDGRGSQWVKREPEPPDLARYEQQF
jgi:hypothetical protein